MSEKLQNARGCRPQNPTVAPKCRKTCKTPGVAGLRPPPLAPKCRKSCKTLLQSIFSNLNMQVRAFLSQAVIEAIFCFATFPTFNPSHPTKCHRVGHSQPLHIAECLQIGHFQPLQMTKLRRGEHIQAPRWTNVAGAGIFSGVRSPNVARTGMC